ncbi:PREDICTED: taste receptor type 1 member 1 [Nanorana parkeri]|uniref:taste receptor type 1 member 1 n=1 Tax=Nanorana parkeri TaxID=125878 RepID=UPI0008550231|nr:PREDICTED: taste receptor type 1 member 1 [Nanorana parkeri]
MVVVSALDRCFALLLHLCAALGCQISNYKSEYRLPGDYVIGGLFPLHKADSTQFPMLGLNYCDGSTFNILGYHLLHSTRMAIEEINNSSTLLPNVTLGYELYDTCSDPTHIYGVLRNLYRCEEPYLQMQNNFTNYKTKAIALVGPSSSSFAFVAGRVLGKFLVPQISYSASNEQLGNKRTYPSFFRTIPSDKLQVEVILNLLQKFKWTWVAIVGSDDVYGRQGVQDLNTLASKNGICIAYQGLIPLSTDTTNVKKMVANIVQTRVKATVVFSAYFNARIFFQEVLNANVTDFVWIGSESWIMDTQITAIANIKRIGSVLGVSVGQVFFPKLLEFETEYVTSPKIKTMGQNGCNQVCLDCQAFTLQTMPIQTQFSMSASFNAYSAVYAIAYALHDLLDCKSGQCSTNTFYPWQLLQKVKKVNFTMYNQTINFDSNGDPATGYDIVMWSWSEDTPTFKLIGSYSKTTQQLQLNDKLQWYTKDNTVPESICSKECETGERRVQTGSHTCCFECLPCPQMSFLNASDLYTCQPCGTDQWSPMKNDICYNRTVEYLPWTDPLSLVLLFLVTLLLLVTIAIAVLFVINLNTPVVKSAGGKMCLGMLLSLALSLCTLYCYFGEPGIITCMVRQPVFAVSFTICFACIVVHAFQIVCIFKMATHMPRIYDIWVKKNGSDVFIAASTAIQVLISVVWIVVKPPRPIADYSTFSDQIILKCSETVSIGSIAEIIFIAFLSMICFIFCYMGKDLPANYNEAKCISFSLLVYFFSWVGYFTTYIIYQGKYLAAVNVGAVLLSVFGILAGYFTPKCYIILLRPEMNTTEHFQSAIQDYTKKQSAHD